MLIKKGDQGNIIKFFQWVLKNIGIYQGSIDGIFGTNTEIAVKTFETRLNLEQTGEITDSLVQELLPYVTVPTTIPYTSKMVEIILNALVYKYRFLNKFNIGTSVLGTNINGIEFGNGKKNILYVASTHANEWITTPLTLKFIEDFAIAYTNGADIYNENARELFNKVTFHILPLHNPDGVDLVNNALDKESPAYLNAISISNDYPLVAFPERLEGKYTRNRFKFTIPCSLGKCKRN